MSYKYTIIQEHTDTRTKLTYEFSAHDEDDMVDEFNTFMKSIGFAESGYLTLVNDEDIDDDLDSEVMDSFDFGRSEMNPELEGFKNFEFPVEEGKGQLYNPYVTQNHQYELYGDIKPEELAATWPFPLDRPSESTYRVDSNYDYESNVTYYGS